MVSEARPVLDRTVFGGDGGLRLCQEKIRGRNQMTYAVLSLFGVRVVSSSSSDKKRFFFGDICNEV